MHSQQSAILHVLRVFELQKFALHETSLFMLKMQGTPCLFLFKTEGQDRFTKFHICKSYLSVRQD